MCRLVICSQYGTDGTSARNIKEELAKMVKQDKVVVFMKVKRQLKDFFVGR